MPPRGERQNAPAAAAAEAFSQSFIFFGTRQPPDDDEPDEDEPDDDEPDEPVEPLDGLVVLRDAPDVPDDPDVPVDVPDVPDEVPVVALLAPLPRVLVPSGLLPGAFAVPEDEFVPLLLSSERGWLPDSGTGLT